MPCFPSRRRDKGIRLQPIRESFSESENNELRALVGILSEGQVGAMLGVKQWTLQPWRMKARGPAYTKLGKSIFYRVEDIKNLDRGRLHAKPR